MIFDSYTTLDIVLSFGLISALIWLLIVRRNLLKRNSEMKIEIQKRVNAEKDLIEKEKVYSKLVHSIAEGIGIVDENEVFIYANKAAEIIFEAEEDGLKGKPIMKYLNIEESEKIKQGTNNRKKGHTDRYELCIITEKGNTRIIEITASPNYDEKGQFVSSYGVFRDVTDYKDAQIKLKENEELFRTLLNNAPLPIFYKSSNGKYLGCNEEFEKFIGRPESEIVGKTVYDLSPQDIAVIYFEKDNELFRSGERQIYEWKALDRYGNERSVVYHKAALRDFFGNITGLIGAIVDITEIKNYEKILERKQDELERSNKDLEDFAYTVSHDLQEPLRMVSGFTDLLLKKYSAVLNEEAKGYINYSVEGAKRMQDQIRGLLAYSRISTQAGPFGKAELKDIVDNALKNLSVSIHESCAEIVFSELPAVVGDKSQLISVFQNLIGNAIKFRKPDTVPKIVIKAETDAEEPVKVRITVTDNGIGIEEKHLEKIFLIFHRLHSQEKYPGTGIGLAIVKKIIERHGGSIYAKSEKNIGTSFIFTLKSGDK